MGEKIIPGPVLGQQNFKEAVCINADKIYDSCKDKDCMENLRCYLTRTGQAIFDRAISVRAKKAEIIWTFIDVDAVPFNKGFYTCDIKFCCRVEFDAYVGCNKPQEIEAYCTYDKKVILFGSEGNAKIYSSTTALSRNDSGSMPKTNMPKCTVEVVDPIVLGQKIVEAGDRSIGNDYDISSIPENICNYFEDDFVDGDECKKLFCTLGLFSIVRLERTVQLLIPAYDFCIPEKECSGGNEEEPCRLFNRIKFPTNEFFPPRFNEFMDENDRGNRDIRDDNCGCK